MRKLIYLFLLTLTTAASAQIVQPDSVSQGGTSFTPQFNYIGANASTMKIQVRNPTNGKFFGLYSAYQTSQLFTLKDSALIKGKNLFDIPNKPTARKNLGTLDSVGNKPLINLVTTKLDSTLNKGLINQIPLKANISDIQSNITIAYADLPSDKKTYTNTALAGKDFTLTKYNNINNTALLLALTTDYTNTPSGGFVLTVPLAPNEKVLLQGTYFIGSSAFSLQTEVDALNNVVFTSTSSGPTPPLNSYTTASTNPGLNTRANQSSLTSGYTISKITVWAIKAGDVRFAIAHRNNDGTYTQDAYTITKTLVLGENILNGFSFPVTQANDVLTFYWDGANGAHGALGAVTGITNGSFSYVGNATGLGSFTFSTSPSQWGINVTLVKSNVNDLSYTAKNVFSSGTIIPNFAVNSDGTYSANTGWKVAEYTSTQLSGFSDIWISNINMRPSNAPTSGYYRFINSGGTVLAYNSFSANTSFNITPPVGWDKFQIDIKSSNDDDAVYYNASISKSEYFVTKIKGVPILDTSVDPTVLTTKDLAFTDSNYFANGTIINNRVIKFDGTEGPSTGWKYIEYTKTQLSAFTQINFNNFNLRPTLGTSGYLRFINSGGTVLSYTGFKANTAYTLVPPAGWDKFQIDIKSPTDNDNVYTSASVSPTAYQVAKIRNIPISGSSTASNTYPTVQNVARKAAISFVFDDGLNASADTMVMRMFKEKNMRCGFALVVDFNPSPAIYLPAQADGFEILSHSINHPYFTNAGTPTISTIPAAENQFKTSYNYFTSQGYNIRGWATPYNAMDTIFIPTLEKYYQYAYTKPALTTANSLATFNWRLSKLARISMENNDTTQIKAAIDLAISQKRFVTFIAHAVDGVGGHMTAAKLQTVLNYVAKKRDDGDCDVLIPADAVNKFFFYNHNDIPTTAP